MWKVVKVGDDPILFCGAGDIQAKPTRVSGGFDLLVIFAGQSPTCVHLELVPPGQLQCDKISAMCAVDGELYVAFFGKESAVFVYDTEAARRQLLGPTAGQRSDGKIPLHATRGVDISNNDNDVLMRPHKKVVMQLMIIAVCK